MKLNQKIILFLLCFIINIHATETFKRGTGLVFDDEAYAKTPIKAALSRGDYLNLPEQSSIKKFSPTPGDQGRYGTCTAWSTVYAARTILEAQKNQWIDKYTITENAFSPGFIYRLLKDDTTKCDEGTNIGKAFALMMMEGAPKLKSLNSKCPSYIPSELYDEAYSYKIYDFTRLFSLNMTNNTKIKLIKKSLYEGKPIVIGMLCPDSFSKAHEVWIPVENPDPKYGGHAMVVVGYDDNKYGGAFEIQNSWGTKWGNEGYIWIKYDDFANFTRTAYEMIPKPKKKPPQIPDLIGSITYQLESGSNMPVTLFSKQYKTVLSYPTGTKFRIYISNNEPAYIYAFGSDLTNKTYKIFPHQDGVSAALTYRQNSVPIPDDDHFIEMDETIGKDYLCVLYSKTKLDIDDIRQQVEDADGSFQERVIKVLKDDIVDFNNIQFSKASISFKAISNDKKIVPIIVEIEHTK